MLSEMKVGDDVFTIQGRWEIVKENYPETIETENGNHFFINGCRARNDAMPSAWAYNPFDKDDKPPIRFKKGEVIAVWILGGQELFRKFVKYEHNIIYCEHPENKTLSIQWTYARKLTPAERGEYE